MATFVSPYHALALEEFLRELGVLRGMRREQAEEIIGDLCGIVRCIVAEAMLDASEEFKVEAILAGYEVLDQQRSWIFENVRRQIASTQ